MLGGVSASKCVLSNDALIIPHSPDLILNDNIFCNEHGYVRLNLVQCSMGLHRYSHDVLRNGHLVPVKDARLDHCLSLDDLNTITDQHVKWRDQREVIPLKYTYANAAVLAGSDIDVPSGAPRNHYGANTWSNEYGLPCSYYQGILSSYTYSVDRIFRPTPKRGNDIYIDIVTERFAPALSAANIVFFDPSWGVKQTKLLYLTVTTDPAVVGSDVGAAWLTFGRWWNSFITNLRRQYGNISYVRTWQSTDNFMPHAHALIYFSDKTFNVVQWHDKNGDLSFRLPSRSHDRSAIKKAWKWGTCDIQCVADTQTAYKDLLKYVTRDLSSGACDKTNGMAWFFEKRSFAISGSFFDVLKNASLEPSDADLICATSDNSNSVLVRVDVFPVMGADMAPKTPQTRLIDEDPPPDLEHVFAVLEAQYVPSEAKNGRLKDHPYCKVFVWGKPDRGSNGAAGAIGDDALNMVTVLEHRCDKCHEDKKSTRRILGVWVCGDCYPRSEGC